MPITFRCQGCGKPMTAGDDLAGMKARCKRCGETIVIPPPTDPDDPFPVAPDPPADPAPASDPARPPGFGEGGVGTTPGPDAEPWYYKVLEVYAVAVLFVGCSQAPLGLIIGLNILLEPSRPEAAAPSPGGGAVLMGSLALLLGSILAAAPILLLVDLARNVRAMRTAAQP